MKKITVSIYCKGQLMSTLNTTKDSLAYIRQNVMNMYGSFGTVIVK